MKLADAFVLQIFLLVFFFLYGISSTHVWMVYIYNYRFEDTFGVRQVIKWFYFWLLNVMKRRDLSTTEETNTFPLDRLRQFPELFINYNKTTYKLR